ncbi:acetyltransferase [Zhihengliuella halotolerans]|uniref:Putative acetyltransferase n=1 Tax=Zhihengliuella halotolerans TaxID=370736 RepID=A0A4Q8ABB8_9MICC|nr:acetyltransferase [Zhihengliuella halotolerans]RZU60951.1 putative acetyltransferase [Zhihengliuella halotolerans]
MNDDVVVRPVNGPGEYPQLVKVWRSAVDATHDFLAQAHRDAIESRLAADYLPCVSLVVAERHGRVIGFAGTADGKLEMLFVDAGHRGGGVGSKLLAHVLEAEAVTAVDVNEQNEHAAGFYERSGFVVTGRSAVDDDGLPYPLLHLRLLTEAAQAGQRVP